MLQVQRLGEGARRFAARCVKESREDRPSNMTTGTPAAELDISEELVRKLLREQQPDMADMPISPVDAGWDNAVFRLGEHDAVRLPRRHIAAMLVENEQTWLPLLAGRLSLPTPVPKRIGKPSAEYPWRWSIVPWLDGRTADAAPPTASQAIPFADFLGALHQPAPSNAPHNKFRGVPLQLKAKALVERIARLRTKHHPIKAEILQIWQQALATRPAAETRWLHGDLHARNVLTFDGSIAGVIDWGDITSGDVATDLASVWSLFDEPQARAQCLLHYGPTPAELARAKGWAVFFATVLLETGLVDHPVHAAMGEAIFHRIIEDTDKPLL